MNDVLIAGCGFLGRRLARRLRDAGRTVHATTRSTARADEFRREGIRPVLCDVTEPASLGSLPRVGTVVHAIGLDRGSGKGMREVYVDGLREFLARLPTPERFLYVSSSSVYGQQDGEEVDESSPTEPVEEPGQIVLAAEAVLRGSLPGAVILRFAGIYGPGRLMRGQAIRDGQPIAASPDRWLNLIHVEDGVSALLAAEERAAPGSLYLICDGHPALRVDFYALLAELLHAPPPRFNPTPGAGGPHERANRRLRNDRLLRELSPTLTYPSFREGLPASCG
jgi:nucleoside-diphosphate-sugar epimerase